jgi:hypothetical protein
LATLVISSAGLAGGNVAACLRTVVTALIPFSESE